MPGSRESPNNRKQYPELAEDLFRMQHRQLPEGWDRNLPEFPPDPKGLATRESSAKVLNAAAKNIPWLIGGAADLAPSTKTRLTFEDAGDFSAENYAGRNFHFGIREHSMGAILNGMSLVKIRPFGSGFFIFVDYMRGSLRLSALMELPAIYVFTHDSIGVGEDGPTHQPIEQLAHMRAMPGLITIRPSDANEVREAWKVILELHHAPAVLVLTRQAVPTIDRSRYAPGLRPGARGLCSRGCRRRRRPRGHPDRYRQRGRFMSGSIRTVDQRGRKGTRSQYAVVGTVRRSGSGVPGFRSAPARQGASVRRAGLRFRLEQVHWFRGAQCLYRNLWGLRALETTAEKVRLHRGERGSRGEEPDCAAPVSRLNKGIT